MYVATYVETPAPGRRPKRLLDLECDFCGTPFEKAFSANVVVQVEHFCSRLCSQRAHRHLCVQARIQPDVVARQQATVQERFGVKTVLALPEVHALSNTPEACLKRHETMVRNGSYFSSRPEERCYELLCEKFGAGDVERQVWVNRWPIDFYVKSIDTYVQEDGVYLHGLDRPIEVIAERRTEKDRQIHEKWLTDRRQNAWFVKNGKRLVRITDK